MQQDNEEQSPQDQGRRVTISFSRDTLLLLAALAFLILAIGLTFLFSPSTEVVTPPGTATSIAGQTSGTSVALATGTVPPRFTVTPISTATAPIQITTGPYPLPGGDFGTPGNGYPAPGNDTTTGTPSDGYPAPDNSGGTFFPTATETGAYPEPVGSPPAQATSAVPTFAPNRPTATSAAVATFPPAASATPTDSLVAAQQTATSTTALPTDTPDTTQPFFTPTPTTPIDDGGKEPLPVEPTNPPVPTAVPVDVLRGNIRWTPAQSPIILQRDVQLAPGAILIIEPGVEVRLAPGVSFFVDGAQFLALGQPNRPVRIVGASGARWEGLFGRPNSYIVLENTEVRGGGAGGTVLATEQSDLVIRRSRFTDNGGTIILTDTRLEMRETEIAGNDLPYGAALDAVYTRGNFVTLVGNRIGGNRLSGGVANVSIVNQSSLDTLNLDIQGNLLRGGAIGNLQFSTNGPLKGTIACNALVGGNQGLNLRTQTTQVPAPQLAIFNNLIDDHTPPIEPIYLDFGIGRGATSEVALDMRNNWWGAASGPYHPESNPQGRGDAVGVNISYEPWLTGAPSCVPPQ